MNLLTLWLVLVAAKILPSAICSNHAEWAVHSFEEYLWKDQSFLTFLFLDKNHGHFDNCLALKAFENSIPRSTLDYIFETIPELYYTHCQTLEPNYRLDMYDESDVQLEASADLEQFVGGLDQEYLPRCLLLPPGTLRTFIMKRLDGLQLKHPKAIFDVIKGFGLRKVPYLKTFSKDVVPLVAKIMRRMTNDDFRVLKTHWSQIVDMETVGESVFTTSELTIIPHLSYAEFYKRRLYEDTPVLLAMQKYAFTFPFPDNVDFVIKHIAKTKFDDEQTMCTRVVESIISRYPLIIIDRLDQLVSIEAKMLGRLLEITFRGLLDNYQQIMLNNSDVTIKLHKFVNALHKEHANADLCALVRHHENDSFVSPNMDVTMAPNVTDLADVNYLIASRVRWPVGLNKLSWKSPFTHGLSNPLVFFEVFCLRNISIICRAIVGIHPYLSQTDLKYVRLFADFIKPFSEAVRVAVDDIDIMIAQDLSNLNGLNCVDSSFDKTVRVPPNSAQLHIMMSLVFESGCFGPKVDAGRRKMFMAVCRLYFREIMLQLELCLERQPTNYTIVDLFQHDKVPKDWLIEHYGSLEERNSRRSLDNFFKSSRNFQLFMDWLSSQNFKETGSPDLRRRVAQIIAQFIREGNEFAKLALCPLSMSIDLLEKARGWNMGTLSVPKVITVPWMVYFANDAALPVLAENNLEQVFPSLTIKQKLDFFLSKGQYILFDSKTISLIADNVLNRPTWFGKQIIREAIITRDQGIKKLCLIKNAFALHMKFLKTHPSNHYDVQAVVATLLTSLYEMECLGQDISNVLNSCAGSNDIIVCTGGSRSIDRLPRRFYVALESLGCFKKGTHSMFLHRHLLLLSHRFNNVKQAVDIVCSRTTEQYRAFMEELMIKDPPKYMSQFWDLIRERTVFAGVQSDGFIYVRVHEGDRKVQIKVPYDAVMADLYYILRSNFGSRAKQVFALVSPDYKQVHQPNGTELRHLQDLEFRIVYSDADSLRYVAAVAEFLGLYMLPK